MTVTRLCVSCASRAASAVSLKRGTSERAASSKPFPGGSEYVVRQPCKLPSIAAAQDNPAYPLVSTPDGFAACTSGSVGWVAHAEVTPIKGAPTCATAEALSASQPASVRRTVRIRTHSRFASKVSNVRYESSAVIAIAPASGRAARADRQALRRGVAGPSCAALAPFKAPMTRRLR